MFARITWGKILPGKWDEFEAAYKKSCAERGPVKGMVTQWLARDQKDQDAGYSISVWESEAAMNDYVGSQQQKNSAGTLLPYFVNQYTVTHCDIRHMVKD